MIRFGWGFKKIREEFCKITGGFVISSIAKIVHFGVGYVKMTSRVLLTFSIEPFRCNRVFKYLEELDGASPKRFFNRITQNLEVR